MDGLSVLYLKSQLPPCIKLADSDSLSGRTSVFTIQPPPPPTAQLAVRLLAGEDTAGNEQPHVLLTFKLEAVEINSSMFVFGI